MATGKQRSDQERLEELDRKKDAIEARQKAIRARVAQKERARDTRRKILVGSLLLHRMENDPENGPRFRLWLQNELPGFLRETDRNLFADILEVADGGGENAETAGEKNPVHADSFQTEAN